MTRNVVITRIYIKKADNPHWRWLKISLKNLPKLRNLCRGVEKTSYSPVSIKTSFFADRKTSIIS